MACLVYTFFPPQHNIVAGRGRLDLPPSFSRPHFPPSWSPRMKLKYKNILFHVLFCSVLFCSALFCCPVLFCSAVLFCSVLSCSVLFCSVLFCSVLFCSVLFCSVLFCPVVLSYLPGFNSTKFCNWSLCVGWAPHCRIPGVPRDV